MEYRNRLIIKNHLFPFLTQKLQNPHIRIRLEESCPSHLIPKNPYYCIIISWTFESDGYAIVCPPDLDPYSLCRSWRWTSSNAFSSFQQGVVIEHPNEESLLQHFYRFYLQKCILSYFNSQIPVIVPSLRLFTFYQLSTQDLQTFQSFHFTI